MFCNHTLKENILGLSINNVDFSPDNDSNYN